MHDTDKLDLKHELGRKAIHVTSLLIIFIFIYFGKPAVLYFLTFSLIIILSVEYFRIEWDFKVPFLDRFFREKERHVYGGEIFFIVGAFIAISAFSKEIAIAAILMTTFGDMAGSLVGKSIGRHKIPKMEKKTVEGSSAEFFVNIIIGYVIFIYFAAQPQYPHPEMIIIVMALTATIVETVTNKLDDNLIIPVFAGSAGEILLILFKFTGHS